MSGMDSVFPRWDVLSKLTIVSSDWSFDSPHKRWKVSLRYLAPEDVEPCGFETHHDLWQESRALDELMGSVSGTSLDGLAIDGLIDQLKKTCVRVSVHYRDMPR